MSQFLQREAAPSRQPMTEAEAKEMSLAARRAFDTGDYKQAITLWTRVQHEWAAGNSAQIYADIVYYVALAKAHSNDLPGALDELDTFRTLSKDKAKGDALAEQVHALAEGAEKIERPKSRAQAEKLWHQAEQAYGAGDYDRATALFRACGAWGSEHDSKVEAMAHFDIAIAKAWAGDYSAAAAEAKLYHAHPEREAERDAHLDDRLLEIRDQNEPPPKGVPKVRTATGAEHAYNEARAAFDNGDYDTAIPLFESVAEWAAAEGKRISPEISSATVYALALSRAYKGDASGAQAAVARYKSLPGADSTKADHLAKRVGEIKAESDRLEALRHPKSAADAEKAYKEAESAFNANDFELAISLWRPVLDWAIHEKRPDVAAATTYDLAIANAHLGAFNTATRLAKQYAAMPGADAARVASLPKRIEELRAQSGG